MNVVPVLTNKVASGLGFMVKKFCSNVRMEEWDPCSISLLNCLAVGPCLVAYHPWIVEDVFNVETRLIASLHA